MTFIAALLAKKIWGIVIFCLAIVATIALPALVVQSVRLNGFSVLWWTISEGYRPMAERLDRENIKLVASNLVLSNGLDRCNGSVKTLEVARVTFVKAAQGLVDEKLRLMSEYNRRRTKVAAVAPTDAVCPSVDAIFALGFGK